MTEPTEPTALEKLSPKQRRFVTEYIKDHNGTQAAIRAGYSERTAGVQAYDLLKRPHIQDAIKELYEQRGMTGEEVVARLADHARASIEDFLGEDWRGMPVIDLKKAKERGVLHLAKRIRMNKGGIDVELVDAQGALFKIAQILKLVSGQMELTGKDGQPLFDAEAAVRAAMERIHGVHIDDGSRNQDG